MKKVIILTAGYGEGHNTAAKGLKQALDEQGCEAAVHDLFASTYGCWNQLSRKAYLAMINHAPWLWQRFYQLLDKTYLLDRSLFTLGKMREALRDLLQQERPEAVVITYPVYGFLLAEIYPHQRPFELFTVVTDSITVNSVWYRPQSDWFIVPNEATQLVLQKAGISASKIQCLGFPVAPAFARGDAKRMVPSQAVRPKVLLMINFAHNQAPGLLRKLLRLPQIDYTVTAGRDKRLLARLEQVAAEAGRHVSFYGWTDQIPHLLMEHHLLISKAGGATVQETLAARTPMLISQVVPGQEEGNAELIVGAGCGQLAPTDEAMVNAVRAVFENQAALWKSFHRNVVALSRPTAAEEIALFVLQKSQRAAMKEPA